MVEILGYTADADTHCVDCTERLYGPENERLRLDQEGNEVRPIFSTDRGEWDMPPCCGECREPLWEAPRSRGSLGVNVDGEYFERDGQVYRAPRYCPLDVDGYRQGARWECTRAHWDRFFATVYAARIDGARAS